MFISHTTILLSLRFAADTGHLNSNYINVNALIARKIIIRIYLYSFTNNELVRYRNFSFIVGDLVQVNPDNSLAEWLTCKQLTHQPYSDPLEKTSVSNPPTPRELPSFELPLPSEFPYVCVCVGGGGGCWLWIFSATTHCIFLF